MPSSPTTRSTRPRSGAARVLVSGMGGELGSLVAMHLERELWVGDIVGCDVDPPRRRLRRARFHLINPHDRAAMADLVRCADPQVVVHVGVYEPGARANPGNARQRSLDAAAAVFTAAAQLPSLRAVVVRSGIEVYGYTQSARSRSTPDETAPLVPSSTFGRTLIDVEAEARSSVGAAGIPVACVRLAPVIGPHIPSPLGRLLRLPLVPFDPLRRARFSVVDIDDAARALVAAARVRFDGPVNVVGAGSLTPRAAARLGGRVACPAIGPGFWAARQLAHAAGAPVPDHVVELLLHGRTATSGAAAEIGIEPARSTLDAVRALYAWPSVTRVVRGDEPSVARAARPNGLRVVNG